MSVKMNVRDKLLDDNLDLSCCDLKEVPVREIANLKRAKNVDLSNNILTSLPKTFITLTQIVKLDLSKNMLTEIPENFGEMVQLRHLDLYKNEISRLPLSLGNLKNLRWLDLKENPLSPAVAKVAGPCTNAADCQTCARNVVTYLANAKLTIEEEQKRLTAAVAENEKLNEKSQPVKKDGKKKKKKDEGKKQMEKEKSPKAQPQEKEAAKASKLKSRKGKAGKGSAVGTFCRFIMWFVYWHLFFASLAFSVLALLPFYDRQTAKVVYDYIELQTGLPVHDYHKVGTEGAQILMENSKLFYNRLVLQTREFTEDVYRRYISPNVTNAGNEL